jgi:predicted Holliday junction resolvase-like endonuclease
MHKLISIIIIINMFLFIIICVFNIHMLPKKTKNEKKKLNIQSRHFKRRERKIESGSFWEINLIGVRYGIFFCIQGRNKKIPSHKP